MTKTICILISSLILLPATYVIQVDDADARSYSQRRQLKRAYAAGAIRGSRQREYRKDHVRKARTRRAVRGAVRLGVAAAVAHNARERHEVRRDHD